MSTPPTLTLTSAGAYLRVNLLLYTLSQWSNGTSTGPSGDSIGYAVPQINDDLSWDVIMATTTQALWYLTPVATTSYLDATIYNIKVSLSSLGANTGLDPQSPNNTTSPAPDLSFLPLTSSGTVGSAAGDALVPLTPYVIYVPSSSPVGYWAYNSQWTAPHNFYLSTDATDPNLVTVLIEPIDPLLAFCQGYQCPTTAFLPYTTPGVSCTLSSDGQSFVCTLNGAYLAEDCASCPPIALPPPIVPPPPPPPGGNTPPPPPPPPPGGNTPSTGGSTGSSTGLIIGIACAIAVLIGGAIIFFVIRRNKMKKLEEASSKQ